MNDRVDVLGTIVSSRARLVDSIPVRQVWTKDQIEENDNLLETHEVVSALIEAGARVTAAFRKLGETSSATKARTIRIECEDAMVALDNAVSRVKGGAA